MYFCRGKSWSGASKRLHAVKDTGLVSMCPIKIVLVLALRTAQTVFHSSWQSLIAHTAARQDKTIQWAGPDQHVLSAFK